MKNNIKTNILQAIVVIILTVLFVVLLISNNAFAKQASDTASPVNEAITKRLEYPSIADLVAPEQVLPDGRVYIRYEDMVNFASILCSGKGIALPGYAQTIVSSGGRSTDRTDGGTLTGFLTMNDKNHATVFKNDAQWVHNEGTPYWDTTSQTYGLFHLVDTYKATPAEAWVLSELDMNDPAKNSIVFEFTDEEYIDKDHHIIDENRHVGSNNTTLWAVEWNKESYEPTRYVAEKNGKYYYVKTDNLAPYTYVQHAWWKVKKVGYKQSEAHPVKDTDLAAEAEAFEAYIKKIAVFQNEENYRVSDLDGNGQDQKLAIGKWQWNEDNTIKVDYKNYESLDGKRRTLGADSTKYNVRFNSETNKYIVGPFTLNYLRAGTKQGTREKVSFSGISQTTLIGTDAQGKQLLDENGESVLKLGKNYRFVYDHNHDDYIPTIMVGEGTSASAEKLDTEKDYPYPYDNEEFYIEVDYLDDMAFLEQLDFDFQYMNAGGSFEYVEGTFLIITWTSWEAYIPETNSGSGSGTVTDPNITYGGVKRTAESIALNSINLSDRAGVGDVTTGESDNSAASENTMELNGDDTVIGGGNSTISNITAEETQKLEDSKLECHSSGDSTITADNISLDAGNIVVNYTKKCPANSTTSSRTSKTYTLKHINYRYNYETGENNSGGQSGTDTKCEIPRDFTAPYEKLKVTVNEEYIEQITWTSNRNWRANNLD